MTQPLFTESAWAAEHEAISYLRLAAITYRVEYSQLLLLTKLLGHLFYDLFNIVGHLLDGFFGFPDNLVSLSLFFQLVAARQRASSFFDSTFYFVCFATHDSNSFR